MFSIFYKRPISDRSASGTATPPQSSGSNSPTNPRDFGIVEMRIRPYRPGQVKYQGTWWTASCLQETALPPGTIVRIVRFEGIRAIVEPLNTPQKLALRL